MTRHVEIKLPPLSGGSANGYKGRFELQLETGVTYKEIHLLTKNLNEDQITKVTITKDGDALVDITGAFFHLLQKYKKEYHDPDVMIIPFADFVMLNQKAQNLSGLVTLPLENWFLKIETGERTAAQAASNAVAEIDIEAITAPVPPWGRLYLPRIYEDTVPANRTGWIRNKSFVEQNKSGNSTAIRRAHYMAEHVAEFQLLQDEKVVFEKTREKNDYDLQRNNRAPQVFVNDSGDDEAVFHFDPTKTDFGFVDKLITNQGSFETRFLMSEAKSIPVIYETVELVATQENVQAANAAGYGQIW